MSNETKPKPVNVFDQIEWRVAEWADGLDLWIAKDPYEWQGAHGRCLCIYLKADGNAPLEKSYPIQTVECNDKGKIGAALYSVSGAMLYVVGGKHIPIPGKLRLINPSRPSLPDEDDAQ